MLQERLPTLSIRCIKSDKLRQTNNEFLDDFKHDILSRDGFVAFDS